MRRLKWLVIIFSICLLVLILATIVYNTIASRVWKTYTDPRGYFHVRIPSNWQVSVSSDAQGIGNPPVGFQAEWVNIQSSSLQSGTWYGVYVGTYEYAGENLQNVCSAMNGKYFFDNFVTYDVPAQGATVNTSTMTQKDRYTKGALYKIESDKYTTANYPSTFDRVISSIVDSFYRLAFPPNEQQESEQILNSFSPTYHMLLQCGK